MHVNNFLKYSATYGSPYGWSSWIKNKTDIKSSEYSHEKGDEPYEPRREKSGLRGFRPGPTQTGLYKIRKELEA